MPACGLGPGGSSGAQEPRRCWSRCFLGSESPRDFLLKATPGPEGSFERQPVLPRGIARPDPPRHLQATADRLWARVPEAQTVRPSERALPEPMKRKAPRLKALPLLPGPR